MALAYHAPMVGTADSQHMGVWMAFYLHVHPVFLLWRLSVWGFVTVGQPRERETGGRHSRACVQNLLAKHFYVILSIPKYPPLLCRLCAYLPTCSTLLQYQFVFLYSSFVRIQYSASFETSNGWHSPDTCPRVCRIIAINMHDLIRSIHGTNVQSNSSVLGEMAPGMISWLVSLPYTCEVHKTRKKWNKSWIVHWLNDVQSCQL